MTNPLARPEPPEKVLADIAAAIEEQRFGWPTSLGVPNPPRGDWLRRQQAEAILRLVFGAGYRIVPESPAPSPRMVDYVPPLDDIKARDAQTEPVPDDRLPIGPGSKYDHARQQHSDYHLDSDEVALGDRHVLLGMLRATGKCGCNCGCHAAEGSPEWPGSCAACCEPGMNCDCDRALAHLGAVPESEVGLDARCPDRCGGRLGHPGPHQSSDYVGPAEVGRRVKWALAHYDQPLDGDLSIDDINALAAFVAARLSDPSR